MDLYSTKKLRMQEVENARQSRLLAAHEKQEEAQKAVHKQLLHSCSNADQCKLGTTQCVQNNGRGVSEMSNRIKFNNLLMMQDLQELSRASKNQLMTADEHYDMNDFERQKNEVNRELIKLQQKMK